MSSEVKSLKIKSIISLFLGAALVITSFVFMVLNQFALQDMLLLVAGGFCLFLGIESAKAANVPSTVGELLFSSGSSIFWQTAVAIGTWFAAGRQFVTEFWLVIAALLMCVVVTLAIAKVKKLEEQV